MSEATKQRALVGRVISDKMDKTATVEIERRIKHAVYGKYITRTSKIKVHDADNACAMGDIISITSSRPMSKTKSWRLVEIIKKGELV